MSSVTRPDPGDRRTGDKLDGRDAGADPSRSLKEHLDSLHEKIDGLASEGRLIVQVLLRDAMARADTNASQLSQSLQSHALDVLQPNQRRAYHDLIAEQEAMASDARELLRRIGLGGGRLFDPAAAPDVDSPE